MDKQKLRFFFTDTERDEILTNTSPKRFLDNLQEIPDTGIPFSFLFLAPQQKVSAGRSTKGVALEAIKL